MSFIEWTDEEKEKIRIMRRSGWTWPEISKEMGRPQELCRAALRRYLGAKESGYADKVGNTDFIFPKSAPRIAVMDIETLPGVGYFWRTYEENITYEMVVNSTCLLSWAGKFLNQSDIYGDILTPEEAVSRDIKRVATSAWEFLKGCDIVIGHNFNSFDKPHLNTSFLLTDLPPVKYIVVDTLQIARANFKFDNNKLAYINRKLGIREKIDNDGFPLWDACSRGDLDALNTMMEYNMGDIMAEEDLYYRFRPYIRNINMGLFAESDNNRMCPVCGSKDIGIEGDYYTPAGVWDSMRCFSCGCLSRGKTNRLTAFKRKALLESQRT